ncbi:MAG: hypothetical protein SFZ02_11850 [bacterium]|nr:hypothetical protein [bacterium]
MKLRFCLLILTLSLLTACQSIVGDTGATATPAPTPEPNMVIQWERDPSYIVFRADVSPDPNTDPFFLGGEVPFCTIYGDGTVVWSQETGSGGVKVLFGPLDDERIRRFVEWLTIYKEIYRYETELDIQMNSVTPVVETLYLNVNGIAHNSDAFGGWPTNYFAEILTACQELTPQPQEYEPQGAWLSVREAPFNNNANSVLWEPTVTGLDLKAVADSGQPQWITGQGLRLLWIYLQRSTPDLQFGQLDGNFVVILQIPNITRLHPAPPA